LRFRSSGEVIARICQTNEIQKVPTARNAAIDLVLVFPTRKLNPREWRAAPCNLEIQVFSFFGHKRPVVIKDFLGEQLEVAFPGDACLYKQVG